MQPLQNAAKEKTKEQSEITIATLQKPLQELQTKYEMILSEKNSLEKYNRNLEEIAQSHALTLKDEKKEKLEWIGKYDTLQNKYHTEIQAFMKRYYLALGLCMVTIIMLLLLNFSEIIESTQIIGW